MDAPVAPNLAPKAAEKPTLPLHHVPLVEATPESLQGYGELIEAQDSRDIEIVCWPQPDWRPVDPGTGDEGGTTEGIFHFSWEGDVLRGRNEAVADAYVLGWSCDPQSASESEQTCERSQVLLWHANYHPDGGQLFFPLDPGPFVVPLALPGDNVKPSDFVAFWFEGGQGLYIHPSVWHEGVFPVTERQRFFDKQGKVHARISADFGHEFGCYLSVPLSK